MKLLAVVTPPFIYHNDTNNEDSGTVLFAAADSGGGQLSLPSASSMQFSLPPIPDDFTGFEEMECQTGNPENMGAT